MARAHLVRAALALAAAVPATLAAQQDARIVASSNGTVAPAVARTSSPILWSGAAPLPDAIDQHVSLITSGSRGDWLYVIGGQDGGRPSRDMWKARIEKDGSVGAWQRDGALPDGRAGTALATGGRHAVLAGGRTSDGSLSREVLLAHLWPDSRLGAWKAAAYILPGARWQAAAIVAHNHIFVIGGADSAGATSTVFRAGISRADQVSPWTTLAPLPEPRSHHSALVHDGAIYVVGGFGEDGRARDDVLRAAINADGSLGAWQVVSRLDAGLAAHAAVVHDGALWVIGGAVDATQASDRVLRAPFNADGTLAAWEVTEATLPTARAHVRQVPVLGDRLFSIGGTREGRAIDEVVVGRFTGTR